MAEELEDPQWEITVLVPMRLPVEMRQDLFEAVAQAVARWEPVNRDGWDADVSGCPERQRLTYRESQELLWLHAEAVWQLAHAEVDFVRSLNEQQALLMETMSKLVVQERSSRQAWAEEAMRLDVELAAAHTEDSVSFRAEDFGLDVDTDAGGIYISLNHRRAARTEAWGDDVNVDYDEDGIPTGVEILRSPRPAVSSSVLPDGEAQTGDLAGGVVE